MSYPERRALVQLGSTVLITAVYTAVMLPTYPAAPEYSAEVFRFWGRFLLILIPISIIARIVIYIIFSILNTIATREGEPKVTDERDRLIELKATRNALYVFMAGFVLAMAALALEQPPTVMFVLLIGAGLAADMFSEFSEFYFYRRGY